ncbi:MAG: hypothetical protein HWE25_12725 [Alphaproteobacteria bacterium]|nr:hypothetical protein [Alphaproteobacteria bacterium]
MLRTIVFLIALIGSVTTATLAKSAEEKAAEILSAAQSYVDNYRFERDEAALSKAYSGLDKVWDAFVGQYGVGHPLAAEFSLIRARAATAASDKSAVVQAWKQALQSNGVGTTTAQQKVGLNVEAAYAAAKVEDYVSSQQFFAAARALAVVRGDDAEKARLYMRIRELGVVGAGMDWRSLRDALYDLRKFSETFAMWTVPRLEAVVGEAEIRLRYQPEGEEKREDLSTLKAEIMLIVDGVSSSLPPGFMTRVRTLNYALEDRYQL